MTTTQQAGWYPDPWGQATQRWWDGSQWSSHVSGATHPAHQASPPPPAPPAGGTAEATSVSSTGGWAAPGATAGTAETSHTANPDAGPAATGAHAPAPGPSGGPTGPPASWPGTEGQSGPGTAGQPSPWAQPGPWTARSRPSAAPPGPWMGQPGPWAGQPPAHHAPWGAHAGAPRPTPLVRTHPIAAAVLAVGVALVAVGSFLPWARVDSGFGDYTVSGMDGDGPLTLIGAIGIAVLGGLAVVGPWVKGALTGLAISALVVSGLVTLVALVDIADVASRFGEADAIGLDMSVGVGLWIVLVGGLTASAGAVIALVASVRRPTPPPALPYGAPPGWHAGPGAPPVWPR